MTTVARALAAYAAGTRHEALPEPVRREGRRAFLNWVGCAIGGADEGTVDHALAALDRFSGPRAATVIGRTERVDIFLAAFLNGVGSSVHSFNDTHFATVAHPTSPVAAALFALAEDRPIDGPSFLAALILGIEIQCRVGAMLVTPPARCGVGLSMAGLVGCIGAAVAAGKALALSEDALTRAIGIAANQSAGLREAHATMSSHFTPGNAARAGLTAALLAQAGFQCSDTMLDGPKGFSASFASHAVPEAALAGLGRDFEILSNAYKPYPCGFVIHPAIDACLDLARTSGFQADDVERLELRVNPLAIQLTNRPAPRDRRQALVSLQHWAAATLVFRKAGLKEGSDEAVRDDRVRAMRERIALVARDDFGRETAEVAVVLRGGGRREAHVRDCRGSIGRPMTDEELEDKFRDQAALAFDPERVEALLGSCRDVEHQADVGRMGLQLRKGSNGHLTAERALP